MGEHQVKWPWSFISWVASRTRKDTHMYPKIQVLREEEDLSRNVWVYKFGTRRHTFFTQKQVRWIQTFKQKPGILSEVFIPSLWAFWFLGYWKQGCYYTTLLSCHLPHTQRGLGLPVPSFKVKKDIILELNPVLAMKTEAMKIWPISHLKASQENFISLLHGSCMKHRSLQWDLLFFFLRSYTLHSWI